MFCDPCEIPVKSLRNPENPVKSLRNPENPVKSHETPEKTAVSLTLDNFKIIII
jgi:hypothetical protein